MTIEEEARRRERFWLRVLAVGCALCWLGVAIEWYYDKPLISFIWK